MYFRNYMITAVCREDVPADIERLERLLDKAVYNRLLIQRSNANARTNANWALVHETDQMLSKTDTFEFNLLTAIRELKSI